MRCRQRRAFLGPRISEMNSPVIDPLETILRLCSEAAPKPWYPRQYAEEAAIPRDALDPPLERLRLGGLIQLTEWVEGRGQGYALTPAGQRALQNPRDLERLRNALSVPLNNQAKPASRPREGDPATYERGETIRDSLLNPTTPWVTYTLLAANILWYLYAMRLAQAQGVDPGTFIAHDTPTAILLKTGAIHGSFLVSGDKWQWGRLLACCFVHGSLLHLGMNMLGLYWVGPLIERMWGHVRFLAIYFIAGLGGSCVMLLNDPNVLGVGASGAIWGIMTSMAAWIILNRQFMPPSLVSNWLRQLLLLFVLNLGIGFVPGISMAAHLGGGAFGAAAAVLLNIQRFGRSVWRWLAFAGVLAVPILCLGALAAVISLDPRWKAVMARQQLDGRDPAGADFKKRRGELAGDADQAANEALKLALAADTLEGRVEVRDPQAVAKAEVALADARGELVAVADSFDGLVGTDQAAEAKRSVLQQYLRKRAELCERTERYLKENRPFIPGTDEVKAWQRLNDECNKLGNQLKQTP
jgi:membrane associated rhomboid family serine protease